jgi:hypothetical protein
MKMIAKGCTCKNVFTMPYEKSDVEVLFITYQQNGTTVFEKQISDCEISDGTVSVTLTQEDTLQLDEKSIVKIQIRVKLKSGAVTKSKIIETYTDQLLKNEVI